MRRHAAVFCAFALMVATAPAFAQTVVSPYCITGTSTNQTYPWWLDLEQDGLDMTLEPNELNAPAVAPAGASASVLASAFAARISAVCAAGNHGCSAVSSASCFSISLVKRGTCLAGPTPGDFCTPVGTVGNCGSGGFCQEIGGCVGGTTPGAPCQPVGTGATCGPGGFCAPGSLPTADLYVGPTGTTASCKVTAAGCSYNPLIRLGNSPAVPALGGWGMAILALLLLPTGLWLILRRRGGTQLLD